MGAVKWNRVQIRGHADVPDVHSRFSPFFPCLSKNLSLIARLTGVSCCTVNNRVSSQVARLYRSQVWGAEVLLAG